MKTPFYELHSALGAKIVDFGDWQMPLQYKSILQEHQAVRQHAGIFDVSHMGRVAIQGLDAEPLLDLLSTNVISGRKNGTATYTTWCHELGGTVDDLIVYKVDDNDFFVVFNASNREKDLKHLLHYSEGKNVIITPHYEKSAILAIQGPQVASLLSDIFPELGIMKPMQVRKIVWRDQTLYVSTTGYTGAGGCEVFGHADVLLDLWEICLARKIVPIGLGARDTLRLEMGYALYGHEISETIAPTESVCRWAVKMQKPHFIGKEALEHLEGRNRFPAALQVQGKGIAREGASVVLEGDVIGRVTSGTFSPSLQCGIALALIDRPLLIGTTLAVEVRGLSLPVLVVRLPFYRGKN